MTHLDAPAHSIVRADESRPWTIYNGKSGRLVTAADGAEAVEVFRREAGAVALAVLDASMPRMSGRQAGEAIRRLDPAVRVLFVSGHPQPDALATPIGVQQLNAVTWAYADRYIGAHPRSDLDVALRPDNMKAPATTEWRIHFHIPLHSSRTQWFDNTSDHITGLFRLLQKNPALCSHLEMETYTWEVMPPELKGRTVVDQLVSEYDWTLQRLRECQLA